MTTQKTSAERLRALEQQYGGSFDKTPQADGTVVVRLNMPHGEIIAARGPTVAEAVTLLELRVAALQVALTGGQS